MSEPHVAGHSTHFLRRLDRIADRQVELALALYRDPELLAEVLRRARLAESAGRIAIALEDDREGPFLVVTRDGKFVTCLGRGMRPTGLTVLGRAQLDAAASHVERMRERIAAARRLEGELENRQLARLVRTLTHAGPMLCREDFLALARLEPLLGTAFVDATIDCNRFVLHAQRHVAALHPRRLGTAGEELLETFWYAFWARSHLIVLSNVGDARQQAAELRELGRGRVDPFHHLIVHAHALGVVTHSVRALWATARHARELLPDTKREGARSLAFRAMRDLTLATIAHSSTRARAEATKAIAVPAADHPDGFERAWGDLLRAHVMAPLAKGTDAARADHRRTLDAWLATRDLAPIDADTISRLELRTPETWLAALASCPMSWVCNPDWIPTIADAIPWLTRCDAADLFPTRAYCEWQPWKYSTKYGLLLAQGVRRALGGGRPATVRVPPHPSRNDRCACGSGAKYKRCCGAAPALRAAA